MIQQRAASLFPEYYVTPFKIRVEADTGDAKKPDLALIDRQYRRWWVVEVEMAHHSLRGHVLPQVEVFSEGRYGWEHAEHMARSSVIEKQRARDMIRGAQPRVLVIVNQNVPSWVEPIHQLRGRVMVVEMFRSGRNQHVLRVNGDHPSELEGAADVVSKCRLDPWLPRLLQIDSPASLPTGSAIRILFRGGLTVWERLTISNKVWLSPVERNPLNGDRTYAIVRDSTGLLHFEDNLQ